MKQTILIFEFIYSFISPSTNRFVNGSEFLLQAHDDAELQQWVGALRAQCQTASGSESRSQTLPASSQKDETKKKSFFTLKKK